MKLQKVHKNKDVHFFIYFCFKFDHESAAVKAHGHVKQSIDVNKIIHCYKGFVFFSLIYCSKA